MFEPRWVLDLRCYEQRCQPQYSRRLLQAKHVAYLSQIVLVVKELIAGLAVVPVMSSHPHMLLGERLGMEPFVTGFVRNSGRPMDQIVDVFLIGAPCRKDTLADFAFRPVPEIIHVLFARAQCLDGLIAGFASWPVIVIVPVVVTRPLSVECVLTGLALEKHRGPFLINAGESVDWRCKNKLKGSFGMGERRNFRSSKRRRKDEKDVRCKYISAKRSKGRRGSSGGE
jgi:hypothetical protein